MRQKLPDLLRPHLSRMPPPLAASLSVPMEPQIPYDPRPVSLLRPVRIMEEPHHLMHLLAQWAFRVGNKARTSGLSLFSRDGRHGFLEIHSGQNFRKVQNTFNINMATKSNTRSRSLKC